LSANDDTLPPYLHFSSMPMLIGRQFTGETDDEPAAIPSLNTTTLRIGAMAKY
jgi:hypothetical protein